MAAKAAKTVKIPDDIEYRVLGNLFCLLIACSGLLGGNMVNQRTLDVWQDDLVPIAAIVFFCFRLFRTFLATVTLYQKPQPASHAAAHAARVYNEPTSVPRIGNEKKFTPEQVVEEVAKRIEAQKEAAIKKNKMVVNQ